MDVVEAMQAQVAATDEMKKRIKKHKEWVDKVRDSRESLEDSIEDIKVEVSEESVKYSYSPKVNGQIFDPLKFVAEFKYSVAFFKWKLQPTPISQAPKHCPFPAVFEPLYEGVKYPLTSQLHELLMLYKQLLDEAAEEIYPLWSLADRIKETFASHNMRKVVGREFNWWASVNEDRTGLDIDFNADFWPPGLERPNIEENKIRLKLTLDEEENVKYDCKLSGYRIEYEEKRYGNQFLEMLQEKFEGRQGLDGMKRGFSRLMGKKLVQLDDNYYDFS